MYRLTLILLTLAFAGAVALAKQVPVGSGSIAAKVAALKPGDYVWAPEVAPAGPVLLVVNVKTQRAVLYRNGVPIAASTVSTGRPGYSTPTGVFTILQKHVEHYSSTYDNAPMPYMQRLTWRGVSLHAGNLPGYPASHGCIRLPLGFAKLLYGVTKVGMTVVITNARTSPKVAPVPALLAAGETGAVRKAGLEWQPDKSPEGPVSIIVSAADRRAIVLRNGVLIGSAPVTIEGPVKGTWVYSLRSVDSAGQHWLRLAVGSEAGERVAAEEWRRFDAPQEFRRAVASIVAPGTTIVVTPDSLEAGATGDPSTVIEGPTE